MVQVKNKAMPVDAANKTAPMFDSGDRTGGDVQTVYHHLRQEILSGSLAPREMLNQVHIARLYGVSRTPVREALRMLQAEGLAEAQFQHRMRVTAVTPAEVDAVYGLWIVAQALAVTLTVPKLTDEEMARIREALHVMNHHSPERSESSSKDDWQRFHKEFHGLLILHAGPIITASIDNYWSRSERARRTYMRAVPRSWEDSEDEHNDTVEAYAERSVEKAIYLTTRQLARIAITVIGHIDPAYDPQAIRQALKLTSRSGDESIIERTRSRRSPVSGLAVSEG